ncbi:hypothetical protein P8452_37405 [Trifolium repens]|nr:hypothetical protein P8452_37405 [Trifolium repens]
MIMFSFMSLVVGKSMLCLVSCLWVLEIQGKNMCHVFGCWKVKIMLGFMYLVVGKSILCLVSCLWVLEIQAKNLEKEHTQIWNKKIWKCVRAFC